MMTYKSGLRNQILRTTRTTNVKQIVLIAAIAATSVITLTTTIPPSLGISQPAFAQLAKPDSPDFNGDGRADLAIGVAGEDIGSLSQAGAVSVLYGSSSGITSTNDQFWSQASSGILETAQSGDVFGFKVTAGDFDGDGFSDLAIGVPSESVGSSSLVGGAVNVIYGSSSGLASSGNQLWSQNSDGILDSAEFIDEENHDNFGQAVAAGDFDGDGMDDLAVGVSEEDISSSGDNAGAVNVIYGSSSGLTATGDQFWHQDVSGVESSPELEDNFGAALAAGDFDSDGFADLAIGVPGEGVGDKTNVGAVNILFGSSSGLTATGDQFWTQDSPGVSDTAERDDRLGNALTSGDFDDDGFADLAIGVASETIGSSSSTGEQDQGAVNVLYGSSSGLSADGDDFWHQDVSGVESGAELSDSFGSSLVSGDFDEDGNSDLAIGVPNEDVGGKFNIGAVNVIYGSSSGLTASGDQFWHQDVSGIEGTATDGEAESFGASLGAGDFNGDGSTDLAVGVPQDFIGEHSFGGAVNVIYGSSSDGLIAEGDQLWHQDRSGVEDAVEDADLFGGSLSKEEPATG